MLTQEKLKELLHYDPDTGFFTWKERTIYSSGKHYSSSTWNTRFSGKIAGFIGKDNKYRICINYKTYLLHRLAWLYIYGNFPKDQIDHINDIKDDNRILNLREASNSENMQNLKKAKIDNKSSGLLGVSFNKNINKFVAKIKINKKQKHIGYFTNPLDAHEAYLKEKRKLHPFGTL